jgi:hypothetical protein
MFQFPSFPPTRLYIQRVVPGYFPGGFPHSGIPGSQPAHGSPRLIAVYHALLRLLAPRHPPYALSSLIHEYSGIEVSAFCSVVKVLSCDPLCFCRCFSFDS